MVFVNHLILVDFVVYVIEGMDCNDLHLNNSSMLLNWGPT